MKSKNDPILDAAALCLETPRTREELGAELVKLGWHSNVIDQAIKSAVTMLYLFEKTTDHRFYPGPAAPR